MRKLIQDVVNLTVLDEPISSETRPSPALRENYRRYFYRSVKFCLANEYVYDLDIFLHKEMLRSWLTEFTPGYEEWSNYIGFRDPQEAFAFRLRWC